MNPILIVSFVVIIILGLACAVLWMMLARTEKELASRIDASELGTQDILNLLLDKLDLPIHKVKVMKLWTKEHGPWYERTSTKY